LTLSNQNINKLLTEITNDLGNKKFLINPYFRIPKANFSSMRKFHFFLNKLVYLKLVIIFLLSPMLILISIFTSFIGSILFNYQNKIFNQNLSQSDCIFLSHAIGQNITLNTQDLFFSQTPRYLNKKGYKSTILYTNHHLFNYRKNYLNLKMKWEEAHHILLPKFLKPSELGSYLRTVVPLALECLKEGAKNYKKNSPRSILILYSILFFFSRQTYSNFLIRQRLLSLQAKYNIKLIFLTFEGHTYEQYLIEELKARNKDISFVLLQHSPIAPEQFGVTNFLKSNLEKVNILTTGNFYIKKFEKISQLPHYYLFGSPKFRNRIKYTFTPSQFLFVPEGTFQATKDFLKLLKFLCERNKSDTLCLRLHPNLKNNFYINHRVKNLKKFHNFRLSSNSLENDLSISKLVFFCSSAVGIETLNTGSLPVFYGEKQYKGLNILFGTGVPVKTCYDPSTVLKFINKKSKIISEVSRYKVYNNLIVKLNYSVLDDVINSLV